MWTCPWRPHPSAPLHAWSPRVSQKLDEEKKGFINADDLTKYCESLGAAVPVPFDEMIAACKPEKEGQLNRSEFDALFSAIFPDVGKKAKDKKRPGAAGMRR